MNLSPNLTPRQIAGYIVLASGFLVTLALSFAWNYGTEGGRAWAGSGLVIIAVGLWLVLRQPRPAADTSEAAVTRQLQNRDYEDAATPDSAYHAYYCARDLRDGGWITSAEFADIEERLRSGTREGRGRLYIDF